MAELKSCPFCGSTHIVVEEYEGVYCVACVECNSRTGLGNKKEVIKLWNTRKPKGKDDSNE